MTTLRRNGPIVLAYAGVIVSLGTPAPAQTPSLTEKLNAYIGCINRLSERPGDTRERFANHDEPAVRRLCDDTALFGTPNEIARKLETLQAGGVEYVMINFGGSRDNIRRFARDIMPAFVSRPTVTAAAAK